MYVTLHKLIFLKHAPSFYGNLTVFLILTQLSTEPWIIDEVLVKTLPLLIMEFMYVSLDEEEPIQLSSNPKLLEELTKD